MNKFISFIWLQLLVFSAFLAKQNGASIQECDIKRNQELDDKTTNSWLIKEIETRNSSSKLVCATKCLQEPTCYTYMVNEDLNLCRLHRVRISSYNRLVDSQGFKSYDMCRANDTIGVPCNNDTECTLDNTVCLNQTCQCNFTWSYSSLNQSCVRDCIVYGTEFTSFRRSFITGHNNVLLKGQEYINRENCTAACLNATDFVCRSFDLDYLRGSCLLSNVTSYLVPDDYIQSAITNECQKLNTETPQVSERHVDE